jgi:hypothetical protein
MPSTLGVRAIPSSQPKVQVITETWDPRISPTITRGGAHETQFIIQIFIGGFAFI